MRLIASALGVLSAVCMIVAVTLSKPRTDVPVMVVKTMVVMP